MEKKKLQVWMPLFLSIAMIAGIFIGYKMRDSMPGKSFFYMEKRRPVQEILDLIERKYVDDVNITALADTAIEAMLSKLDPHSSFIPASELDRVNEDIQGSFFGIGIEFDIYDDTLNVVNVLKDGPGFKAGVKTGDKFIEANDIKIAGKMMKADSIRNILRGNRGSSVTVDILRNSKIINLSITRDIIPVSSVDAAYMLNSETGYLRLNKFSTQTYREFMLSLEALKKKGMTKMVLDLRGNGGGVLEEAVEIADEFLEGDKLITYTEGKHTPRKEFRCRRQGQFEKGALVVLSDESSASASEILMGALQDWDRATIIGRRSFGKGLVQEQFNLSDRSALRLTIARYYTPTGRSIQRSYANGGKAYYDEIGNRFLNRNDAVSDSIKLDTGKIYQSPSGKKLYGGGGITPDLYITGDTGKLSEVIAKIYTKGLVNHFGYLYVLNNPSISAQYKDAGQFSGSFEIGATQWAFFEQIASRDSVNLSAITTDDRAFINKSMKAAIARQVWRNDGYFEVYNATDSMVMKSLELLK